MVEDFLDNEAFVIARDKARAVVTGGTIPAGVPIGRLSDVEWGWIVGEALSGWICARAFQATRNGYDRELQLRTIAGWQPPPWDAGAIAVVLPALAAIDIDWEKPLGRFTSDEIIKLLGAAYQLVDRAMAAQKLGEQLVPRDPRTPEENAEQFDEPMLGI
jgi:hypothetical protein